MSDPYYKYSGVMFAQLEKAKEAGHVITYIPCGLISINGTEIKEEKHLDMYLAGYAHEY